MTPKKAQAFYFCLLVACLVIPGAMSVEIFYLQETPITSNASVYPSATLTSFAPSFSSTNKYAWSAWFYKTAWTGGWERYFRIALSTSDLYNGRIAGSHIHPTTDTVFTGTHSSTDNYDWSPWKGANPNTYIPLNTWVFIAQAVDVPGAKQYGFVYYLGSTYSITQTFKTRSPPSGASFYSLTTAATFKWTNDNYTPHCSCKMQYVRVYADYIPYNEDMMISLAVFNPHSQLFLFHFAVNSTVNSGQTVPVDVYTPLTTGTTTGVRGSSTSADSYDPSFTYWNVVQCRQGTGNFVVLPLSQPNANGLIVAVDIYPRSGGSYPQTIFAIRNSANSAISFTVEFGSNMYVYAYQVDNGGYWNLRFSSLTALTNDAWNRFIIEIVQAQPSDFGVSSCSGRMWVNGAASTRTYFTNFASGSFRDMNNVEINLCSRRDNGYTTPVLPGYYDAMNFIWFKGAEGLYVPTGDASCLLAGFINDRQRACLQCASNYYMVEKACVSSTSGCPTGYVLHSGTKSCQRCQYGGYFKSDGECDPCVSDGLSLIGSSCVTCHSSCRKCIGTAATQCTACYPGYYFWSANNSCVTCTADGVYISGLNCLACNGACKKCVGSANNQCTACYTGNYLYAPTYSYGTCTVCTSTGQFRSGTACLDCHSDCQYCTGTSADSCTSCYTGKYLYATNNSCLTCNSNDGFGRSGSSCVDCNEGCRRCSGTLATECTACYTGLYFYSYNSSCVACNVDGVYISGSSCYKCHTDCRKCYGTAATQCSACYTGKYLLASNNSCVTCNAAGYGPSGTNCVTCDTTCATCTVGASPTSCTTCVSGRYLYAGNNTCLTCNVDYYGRSGSNCVVCDLSCRRCTGTLPTQCTMCWANTYLYSGNNTCLTCLVDGYGISGANCVTCAASCRRCYGIAATQCNACYSGYYLYAGNNSCLTCNVNGFGPSGTACVVCAGSCARCSGTAATQCTACYSGKYLYSANNSCVSCDVDGVFISGTDCLTCDSSCLTCSGSSTTCLTCQSGLYFYAANSSCLACNVDGYSISGSDCIRCDDSCRSCTGTASTQCTSCYSGSFLVGGNSCSQYAGVKHTLFDRDIDTGDIIAISVGSAVALGIVGVVIWLLKKDPRTLKYLRPTHQDELPIEESSREPQVERHDEARVNVRDDNVDANQEIELRDADAQEKTALENEQTKVEMNAGEAEAANNPEREFPLTQFRIKRARGYSRPSQVL